MIEDFYAPATPDNQAACEPRDITTGDQVDKAGRTRRASSSLTANASMTPTWSRMIWRTVPVDALPTRSQRTFGGGPYRKASWRKSEFFETMT